MGPTQTPYKIKAPCRGTFFWSGLCRYWQQWRPRSYLGCPFHFIEEALASKMDDHMVVTSCYYHFRASGVLERTWNLDVDIQCSFPSSETQGIAPEVRKGLACLFHNLSKSNSLLNKVWQRHKGDQSKPKMDPREQENQQAKNRKLNLSAFRKRMSVVEVMFVFKYH